MTFSFETLRYVDMYIYNRLLKLYYKLYRNRLPTLHVIRNFFMDMAPWAMTDETVPFKYPMFDVSSVN